jgi:hypothetical protein
MKRRKPLKDTAQRPNTPLDVDSISRGTYCAIEPPELLCESGRPPGVTWDPEVPAWVLLRFQRTPQRVTITQSGQEAVWEPAALPPATLPVTLALPVVFRDAGPTTR